MNKSESENPNDDYVRFQSYLNLFREIGVDPADYSDWKYPVHGFKKQKCIWYAQEKLNSNPERIKYFKYCLVEYLTRHRSHKGKIPSLHNNPVLSKYDDFYNFCNEQITRWESHVEIENEYPDKKIEGSKVETRTIETTPSTETESKIKWSGTEGQLIYLVKLLIEKGFLPDHLADEPFAFIEKHFLNARGKPFKSKQLSQSKYQYEVSKKGKPKRAEIVDQIVERMEREKNKY